MDSNIKQQNPKDDIEQNFHLRLFFEDQLKEVYAGGKLLISVLPKMEIAADFALLKNVFSSMGLILLRQLSRLEEAFAATGIQPEPRKNIEVEDLIDKADIILKNTQVHTASRDLGLVLVARKIEHYQISTYSGLLEASKLLNQKIVEGLLKKSYHEHIGIDSVLMDIEQEDLTKKTTSF